MRLLTVTLIGTGLIIAAVLGWAVASGRFGGGSSEPESVSPLLSPTTLTSETPALDASSPLPDASPTAPPLLEPALLYSQFSETEDTLWLASASQLQERRAVATVSHAPFWGISASLSPDGRWVAYTALPATVPNPEQGADDQAEVWVQAVAGGEPRLLAQNADVRVAPVWSPDGGTLAFQSFDRRRNSVTLFGVDIGDGIVSVLADLGSTIDAFPLTFAPNSDRFYVAQISEGGTDLLAIDTADGSVETVTGIAGGIARGWRPSPDGLSIAFINQISGQEWELAVATLAEGTVNRLDSQAIRSGQALFSPVWHPEQPLLTVGTAPGDGGGVLNLPLSGQGGERLPGPAEGFDVPLGWSPNGDYLVVQQFSEYPVQRRSSLYLLTTSGERQRVAEGTEVTFVGWLVSAE